MSELRCRVARVRYQYRTGQFPQCPGHRSKVVRRSYSAWQFCFQFCGFSTQVDNSDSQQWESLFERRSIGRTKIAKGALLFFGRQAGVRSCAVTDITKVGAGVRAQDMTAIPLTFELTFDNFHTVRECRLIWRDGDFLGVAFQN